MNLEINFRLNTSARFHAKHVGRYGTQVMGLIKLSKHGWLTRLSILLDKNDIFWKDTFFEILMWKSEKSETLKKKSNW